MDFPGIFFLILFPGIFQVVLLYLLGYLRAWYILGCPNMSHVRTFSYIPGLKCPYLSWYISINRTLLSALFFTFVYT